MSTLHALAFFGRFLIPFTRIGFALKGLRLPERYPGLEGRTIAVTGATGGIGGAIALGAVRSGATVLAIARNPDKLRALQDSAADLPGRIEAWPSDLSSALESLALARAIAGRGGRLDGLVNNVGILNHDHATTDEGVEQMYAVNILNPFILTRALIADGVLGADGVVVNMASGGMYTVAQNLRFMAQGPEGFDGTVAYGTHKRAQLVLSDLWTRDGGPAAYTMHPGWVDTDGVKRSLPQFRKLLRRVLRNPEQGADTALWLLAERPAPEPGALWFDRAPRSAHVFARTRQPRASDAEILALLTGDADRLTGGADRLTGGAPAASAETRAPGTPA